MDRGRAREGVAGAGGTVRHALRAQGPPRQELVRCPSVTITSRGRTEQVRSQVYHVQGTLYTVHCTLTHNNDIDNLDALGGSLYLRTPRRPLFCFSNSELGPYGVSSELSDVHHTHSPQLWNQTHSLEELRDSREGPSDGLDHVSSRVPTLYSDSVHRMIQRKTP